MSHNTTLLRLFKSSNWNIAAFLLAAFVQFATLPIVIRNIGLAQFGAAGIFLGVLAPLMLVGAVIGQACTRDMSRLLASSQTQYARDTFWSGLWLCGLISFAIIILFGLFGKYILKQLMGGEIISEDLLNWLCLIAATGWGAQQLLLILQAGISSTQNYQLLAVFNGCSAVFSAICLLIVTIFWPTIGGFLFSTMLGFFLSFLLGLIYIKWKIPALFPLVGLNGVAARRILHFGRWQGLAQFAGSISMQADRMILGFISTLSIVGQLNIATRLQEVVYMGILKITEVLFPYFSVENEDSRKEGISVLIVSSWFTNAFAASALAPLVPLSGSLIHLWVGESGLLLGASILATLVSAGLIGCGSNALIYFMLAQSQSEFLAKLNIFHSIVVIIFSITLLLIFGPIAAGVGFLIANILRMVVFAWKMPEISNGSISAMSMTVKTQVPIFIGLIFAWTPWPSILTNIVSWVGFVSVYALAAFLIFIVNTILILFLPKPRAIIFRMAINAWSQLLRAH